MLLRTIRGISHGIVETKDGETFEGPIVIDRQMNTKIGHTEIKGTQIRYIRISDEEMNGILERTRREH